MTSRRNLAQSFVVPRFRIVGKQATPVVVLAMLGLAMALVGSTSAQGAETYAEAYRLASKTGQPMVVLVGAEWCAPCQKMKREVIPQVRRRGLLGRVAFAMVNVDRERDLSKRLVRGGRIPQLLMFRPTPKGWRLSKLTGEQSVPSVEAFIDHGLKRDAATKAETVQASHVQTLQVETSAAQSEQAPASASDTEASQSE